MKITSTLLFLLLSIFSYSQTNKPEIIKKDIPVNKAIDIIGFQNSTNKTTPVNYNTYNSRIRVYFNNKFYSADTLRQIKNIEQYNVEVIPIPSNISKDLDGIIYVRKKDN